MSRATRRLKATLLAEILAEDVPHLGDGWTPPPNEEVDDEPRPTVTVTALGGPTVELDEQDFQGLVERAGLVLFGDLTQTDMGRLMTAAKDRFPRHLLHALLSVRTPTTPVYRVRKDGRPWRPPDVNPNPEPTGIQP